MSRSQRHKKELQGIVSDDPIGTQPSYSPRRGSGQLAPTNITLSPATITAASAIGTVVGTLTTTDPAGAGGETYSLTNDESGNWSLGPNNNQVRKALAVTAGAHSIVVLVTDYDGMTFSKTIAITVT